MQSFNFSAGPAVLPASVLSQIQRDLQEAQGSQTSILEISHRSATFQKIIDQAQKRLRDLMKIPNDYAVLFIQGGGSLQFEMMPLNFANKTGKVAVLDSGSFAHKAALAATAVGKEGVEVASSRAEKYRFLPSLPSDFDPADYDYLHITANNTIEGTAYHANNLPQTTGRLVADMSSNILAEPYDITKFDAVFAGAQKNLGPAGITLAIVKKEWLAEQTLHNVGPMMSYQTYIDKDSLYNTPPVFAIYALNLVLGWLEEQGGVEVMFKKHQVMAGKLYDYLDHSDFYHALVKGDQRSWTNVVFTTGDAKRDAAIAEKADKAGLHNLAGHRSVGGFRASMYNAQADEAVEALITFLEQVRKEY
ncbi:3-phosphoserine/phosphohydroxythreonine transaminase [Eupransor demetentiae]|uniref:Phosphoserine aminotransferase n=1 Tax=Eupransor demetentiae TaxID=3109584 RepID=A0ABP0EPN5_9LACO|nr:Phosphoserine aminotransferase (SerC) [Lactobacillaceae bacterium LMG 33000]